MGLHLLNGINFVNDSSVAFSNEASRSKAGAEKSPCFGGPGLVHRLWERAKSPSVNFLSGIGYVSGRECFFRCRNLIIAANSPSIRGEAVGSKWSLIGEGWANGRALFSLVQIYQRKWCSQQTFFSVIKDLVSSFSAVPL